MSKIKKKLSYYRDFFIGIRTTESKKKEIQAEAKKTHHSTGQFLIFCYEKYKEAQNNA